MSTDSHALTAPVSLCAGRPTHTELRTAHNEDDVDEGADNASDADNTGSAHRGVACETWDLRCMHTAVATIVE
jgi:hypothetical protein